MKKYVLFLLVALLCFFSSCSKTEPEIASPQWGEQQFDEVYTVEDISDKSLTDIQLTVDITVPFIENAAETQAWSIMNDSFAMLGGEWRRKAVEWLGTPELEADGAYSVEVDSSVMRTDDEFVSIRYEYYRYLGGAYPVMSLFGTTYKSQTGDPVTLSELFNVTEDVFLPVLMDQMEILADGQFDRADMEAYFDFNFFYITQDALVIFYQEDQLGPHAVGTPEFQIPIEALSDIWAN